MGAGLGVPGPVPRPPALLGFRLAMPGRVAAGSGWCGVEGGDADQVVDGGGHLEPGPVAGLAEVAQLAAAADGLDPPEGSSIRLRILMLMAWPACLVVAGVDGGALSGGVLGDVGR